MMNKERMHWLDVAKGIAIVLVVMGHVTSNFSNDSSLDISESFRALHRFIYSFHMPLFLFISGFLFVASLKKEYKTTAIGKLVEYGIPYIIFSFGYWLIKALAAAFVHNTVNIKDLLFIPLFPLSFMWYLYALLIMVELTLFISKTTKNMNLVIVIAIICRLSWEILSASGWISDSWIKDLVLIDFIKNYIWFAVGIVYGKDIVTWISILPNQAKIFSSIILLEISVVLALFCLTNIPFVRMILAIQGTIAVLTISMLIGLHRFLEYLGQNTMQIYLIHGTVISVLKIITTKIHFPIWGGYCPLLFCTLIAIAIPLMIVAVSKRVVVLDFMFFPNKYAKIGKRERQDE